MIGHLQAECHQRDDAGELEITLGEYEGEIGGEYDDAVLHHLVTLEPGNEEDGEHRKHIAQQGASTRHHEELQERRTAQRCLSAECSEEKHKEHDAGSVVQQRLSVHEGGESLAGIQFLQQGHDRDWVRGADKRTEHQGESPVPSAEFRHDRGYAHHQQGRKPHGYDHPGDGQDTGIHKGLAEGMQVELVCSTEDQDREKDIEQHVRIDVTRLIDSPFQETGLWKQAIAEKHSDEEPETEEPDRIWEFRFLQQQFQQRPDEQRTQHEKQRGKTIFLFHHSYIFAARKFKNILTKRRRTDYICSCIRENG